MNLNGQAITYLASNNDTRETGRPWSLVLHTIVNSGDVSAAGMRATAQTSDGTKPHYYADRDGRVYQLFEDNRKGACNWAGDRFMGGGEWRLACSIETEDETGANIGPYTPEQFEGLARVIADWCLRHGVKPELPRSPWDRGVGFHSMWGYNERGSSDRAKPPTENPWGLNFYSDQYGYWVLVRNPWTKTVGKTCPALRYLPQPPLSDAWMRSLTAGAPPGGDKISQHLALLTRVANILASPKESDVDLVRVPGTGAVFIRGAQVEWLRDPNRANGLAALYGAPKDIPAGELKLFALLGDVPAGDSRPWTEADFAQVLPKGPKGDPGPPLAPGSTLQVVEVKS